MTTKELKSYSELLSFDTFKERFEYLKLGGDVGREVFGFERYLNQKFYSSNEWKTIRNGIIVRDMGCDLGIKGYEIQGRIIIHHMNPINADDIRKYTEILSNPEYLISVSLDTHNALHFGSFDNLQEEFVERKPNDTCPWKNQNRS